VNQERVETAPDLTQRSRKLRLLPTRPANHHAPRGFIAVERILIVQGVKTLMACAERAASQFRHVHIGDTDGHEFFFRVVLKGHRSAVQKPARGTHAMDHFVKQDFIRL
jgi:hypothetical protein